MSVKMKIPTLLAKYLTLSVPCTLYLVFMIQLAPSYPLDLFGLAGTWRAQFNPKIASFPARNHKRNRNPDDEHDICDGDAALSKVR